MRGLRTVFQVFCLFFRRIYNSQNFFRNLLTFRNLRLKLNLPRIDMVIPITMSKAPMVTALHACHKQVDVTWPSALNVENKGLAEGPLSPCPISPWTKIENSIRKLFRENQNFFGDDRWMSKIRFWKITSKNDVLALMGFSWNPYLKRDGGSRLVIFSVKDPKQQSAKILFKTRCRYQTLKLPILIEFTKEN